MRLTTFSDYSVRVLVYLALNRDRLATIPEIAAVYDISENHLMKVVNHLAHAGVIDSVRGKGGGIRLAREPEELRLGQLVRASEGAAPLVECMAEDRGDCRIAPACRFRGMLLRAFDTMYATLDEYTLADLVNSPRRITDLLVRR